MEESRVATPVAPALDALEMATRAPAPLPPLEGYTFEGYRNPDGSVGTKNILAISTSVQCVAGALEFAIKRIKDQLLPLYPNVDDVVAVTHAYGCGVAIGAPQAVVPIRTLQSLARHPNFGGEVRRYGEVVGIATQAIPRGAWVEESRVATPVAPALDALEMATRVPAPLPPLEGYTFEGYRNPDGSVGTKNILAI